MFNLPFVGQTFKLSGIRFEPDPKGRAILKAIMTDRTAVMHYRGKNNRVWTFPDGTFSVVKLEPFQFYKKKGDRFVYDRVGVYRISGIYPNFKTNTGQTVFMDYDRTFRTEPVDMVARGAEYAKDLQQQRHTRMKRSKVDQVLTVKRRIDTKPDGYHWSLTSRGSVLASGTSDLYREAEREMIRVARLAPWRNVR